MKVAIVTAGGAGMFCGSCMQDNTLARTLRMADVDALLVPTYTPIRVDEENVSDDRVFLGGINVYLDSAIPGWNRLPTWLTGWLSRPSVIQTLAKLGSTDAARLGSLTMDMLLGKAGPQKREIAEFADFICDDLKPDVVVFSNALLSGVLSTLCPRFNGKVLCMLQGDDIFLDALNKRWKAPVISQMKANCRLFDGFLTHSTFYQEHMCDYLDLPQQQFRRIPLTIEADLPSEGSENAASATGPVIGYFARICPEKGIQNFLNAATRVLPDYSNASVHVAGYLPAQHRRWFRRMLRTAELAAPGRVHWLDSPPTREEKFAIIRHFDYLCVPTDYKEPKGLYVLEAGMAGIPSIVPDHGAFPELVESISCGTLYDPSHSGGLEQAFRDAIEQVGDGRNTHMKQSLPSSVRDAHGMHETSGIIRNAIESLCQ